MVATSISGRLNVPALALSLALLLGGCAAFPVAEPPPERRAPETGVPGTVPRLPTEQRPAPPEAVPVPRGVPAPEPAPAAPVAPSYHPAGEALVEQARREALLGNDALAGATLERALRIDGNNPWIWIELGHLRLDAGQRAAAESMARKALSLTSRDPVARDAASALLQRAGASR